jgi:radical SAM protein with 4Fe4S-binding SPASM domain
MLYNQAVSKRVLDHLLNKVYHKGIPTSLFFELTYNCNLKCIHCLIVKEKKKKELTYKEVCNIIDQIADFGCFHIRFTGGEVFTRNDFLDIIRYTRKKKLGFSIFTNGTLIDYRVLDEIVSLCPIEIVISLLGANAVTHNIITRDITSYGKTLKCIQFLSKRGVMVRALTTVMKQNANEVTEIEKLSKKIGASSWHNETVIFPKINGSKEPLAYQPLDYQLENVISSYPKDEFRFTLKRKVVLNSSVCPAAKEGSIISPYGDLDPCMCIRAKRRNLKYKSFIEIWENDSEFKELRALKKKDLPKCRDCEFLLYCAPCPGLALFEKGNITLPAQESCRRARIQKRIYENKHKKVFLEN